VNLDTHISDVVNLIRLEALNDVVLWGRSYGGWKVAPIPAAAHSTGDTHSFDQLRP
jgi:hypothetical protein